MRAMLLVWAMLMTLAIVGQDPERLPQLERDLSAASTDSARARILIDIAYHSRRSDPAGSEARLYEALAMAKKARHRLLQAEAYADLSLAFQRKDAFDRADSLADAAWELSSGDQCLRALVLNAKGLILQSKRDDAGALDLFLKAHQTGKDCPDPGPRSARAYAVGSIYSNMKRYEEALTYFRQCAVLDSLVNNRGRLARVHLAMANALGGLDRTDSAMLMYDRAIALAQEVGDSVLTGYMWYNKAELALKAGNAADALRHSERSVAVFDRLGSPAEVLHAGVFHGYLLMSDKRWSDARERLNACLELSTRMGIGYERARILRLLSDVEKRLGNDTEALRLLEDHLLLKDSLDRTAQNERLAEITARYENERTEKELQTSKAREAEAMAAADRLRAQRTLYIGGAVVLCALLLLFITRYRLKRRAAEDLMRVNAEVVAQKERAEESERAKDRFLANVSHEIRTPLNAIMGFTGLLMHEHRDERSARYLNNIRQAGDNLLVVINDVLDLSRIEAGRLRLVSEPFDLHRCVRLCREILQHRAEEQGNVLLERVAPGVPERVMGDSARVLQILLNLAGNALKFTRNGEVALLVSMNGDRVRFEVRDNGIGIPEEKLGTIFERFTQVDIQDQRKYGGTGLGLAIVKELVDLHKGSIRVHSSVGKGTTFTVDLLLPATEAPRTLERERVSTAPNNGSLSGRTVLVAEDNEMNALVTTETLRRSYPAAELVVVRTGREAVERVANDVDGDIGLVLMDVQMPEMDGMSATRAIRALSGEQAQVPIIALTASVLPNDLSRCLDAGMDACVPKPFSTEELVRTIGSLTGDAGAVNGTGDDAHDAQLALFHWLIPPRLKALRSAITANDRVEVEQLVHTMRPQLVAIDGARFAPLCDRILSVPGSWTTPDAEALANAIGPLLT